MNEQPRSSHRRFESSQDRLWRITPLGRARYSLSEYAEAEQAFTRAALLDKDFEAAELMLLHVCVRQGKLSTALSRMNALLQKNPGSSSNPALEEFRSEVVAVLAKLKQGAEKQK